MARFAATMVLIGSLSAPTRVQASECEPYVITAFSAEQYPGRMANGESTWGALGSGDFVAAASWNIALGDRVDIAGLGTYRIADRGYLGALHVDILMATTAEAIEFGRQIRTVCVQ